MQELVAATRTTTRISSLEIADRTDKLHKDVMRDIRNLIDQEAITERNFALSEYRDASGKCNPMYRLDFEATMTLVTGYDANRRNAVIKRWLALERGEAAPMASLHDTLCETPVINNLVGGLADIMATMNRVLGRLERLESAPAETLLSCLSAAQLSGLPGIQAFVSSGCRLSPEAVTDKRTLYNHYRNWCRASGEPPYDYSNFCKGLYQTGLPLRRAKRNLPGGKRGRLLLGVAIPALEAQS